MTNLRQRGASLLPAAALAASPEKNPAQKLIAISNRLMLSGRRQQACPAKTENPIPSERPTGSLYKPPTRKLSRLFPRKRPPGAKEAPRRPLSELGSYLRARVRYSSLWLFSARGLGGAPGGQPNLFYTGLALVAAGHEGFAGSWSGRTLGEDRIAVQRLYMLIGTGKQW
jgi:hypothetical protein